MERSFYLLGILFDRRIDTTRYFLGSETFLNNKKNRSELSFDGQLKTVKTYETQYQH